MTTRQQTISNLQGVTQCVTGAFGSGMLMIPYAFKCFGYVFGLFVLILFVFITAISLYLLSFAANEVQKQKRKNLLIVEYNTEDTKKDTKEFGDTKKDTKEFEDTKKDTKEFGDTKEFEDTIEVENTIEVKNTSEDEKEVETSIERITRMVVQPTYGEIGESISENTGYFIELVLIIKSIFTGIFFLTKAGDICKNFINRYFNEKISFILSLEKVILLLAVLVFIISYFMKNPKFQSLLSTYSLIVSFYYIFLMVGFGIFSKNKFSNLKTFSFEKPIKTLCIFVFSLHSQFGYLSITSKLKNQTLSNKIKIIYISGILITLIYGMAGLGGYKLLYAPALEVIGGDYEPSDNVVLLLQYYENFESVKENLNESMGELFLKKFKSFLTESFCFLFMIVFLICDSFYSYRTTLLIKESFLVKNTYLNSIRNLNLYKNESSSSSLKLFKVILFIYIFIITIFAAFILRNVKSGFVLMFSSYIFTNLLSFGIPGFFGVIYGNKKAKVSKNQNNYNMQAILGWFLITVSLFIFILGIINSL